MLYEVITPESGNVLESVSFNGGEIVAQYMKDAHNVVEVYAIDGKLDYELQLPGIGSVGGFSGKKEDAESFFSYRITSYNVCYTKLLR